MRRRWGWGPLWLSILVVWVALDGLPRASNAEDYPFGQNLAEWLRTTKTFQDDRSGQCGSGYGWVRASRDDPPAEMLRVDDMWGIKLILWLEPGRVWVAYPAERQFDGGQLLPFDRNAPWHWVAQLRPAQVVGVDICYLIRDLVVMKRRYRP